MAYDFPASPTVGQIFTAGTTNFQWNGYAWIMQSGNIGPQGPEGPIGPQGPQGIQGPQGGLTGAPMDGNEYVIVNGVYRLKRQEFQWPAGANIGADIVVPTVWTPRRLTLNVFMSRAVATVGGICWRGSIDGTTFLAAQGDYYYAGLHGQAGTPYMQTVTAFTFGYLSFTGDNTSVGGQCTAEIELQRLANSVFLYRSVWGMYHNTAGVIQRDGVMVGYTTGNFGAAPRLKAIRVFLDAGVASEGYISAEWS